MDSGLPASWYALDVFDSAFPTVQTATRTVGSPWGGAQAPMHSRARFISPTVHRSLILSVVVMAPSARSCVTQGAMLPEIQTGISWTGARSREMRLGRPPIQGCRGLLWHVIRPRQQDSLRGASDDGPGHPTHGPGTGGGMGAFSMVPAPGEPRQPMLERINPSTWPQASGSYSAAAASPSGTGQLRWSQA